MKRIAILLLIVSSCKQTDDTYKKNIIKQYFAGTGHTVEYQYIVKGEDTILHGKSVTYNEQGKVIAIGNYSSGSLEGRFTSYYENGKIEFEKYLHKGENYGESIFYYHNSHLEKYVLYNRANEIAFIVDFDRQGNVIKYDGSIFADWFYINQDPSNLKKGDTLEYGFVLPNIPHVKKTFTIELLDYDNKKIIREISALEPVGILIKEKIFKEGENIFKGKLKLEFPDTKQTIIKDSISLRLKVKQ